MGIVLASCYGRRVVCWDCVTVRSVLFGCLPGTRNDVHVVMKRVLECEACCSIGQCAEM